MPRNKNQARISVPAVVKDQLTRYKKQLIDIVGASSSLTYGDALVYLMQHAGKEYVGSVRKENYELKKIISDMAAANKERMIRERELIKKHVESLCAGNGQKIKLDYTMVDGLDKFIVND
jgi:hypothetical protein